MRYGMMKRNKWKK